MAGDSHRICETKIGSRCFQIYSIAVQEEISLNGRVWDGSEVEYRVVWVICSFEPQGKPWCGDFVVHQAFAVQSFRALAEFRHL